MGSGKEFGDVNRKRAGIRGGERVPVGFGDSSRCCSIPQLFSHFIVSFFSFSDFSRVFPPGSTAKFTHGLWETRRTQRSQSQYFPPWMGKPWTRQTLPVALFPSPGNSRGSDPSWGQECSGPCRSFRTISHLDFCSSDSKMFQRLLFPARGMCRQQKLGMCCDLVVNQNPGIRSRLDSGFPSRIFQVVFPGRARFLQDPRDSRFDNSSLKSYSAPGAWEGTDPSQNAPDTSQERNPSGNFAWNPPWDQVWSIPLPEG